MKRRNDIKKVETIVLIAVFVVISGVLVAVMVSIARQFRHRVQREHESRPIIVTTAPETSSVTEETVSVPEETDPSKNLEPLNDELRDKIAVFDGTWSVYVKHLGTGKELVINDREMYAASLIKLYCIGAIQQAVEGGNLTQEEVREDEKNMIMYSDNYAFDSLVDLLPDGYISEWCVKHDYWETQQTHELSNDWAYQVRRTGLEDNMTSVQDTGHFLETVYNGTCVSEESSAWILKLLKKQKTLTKIPKGLPKGVVCANKTGETDDYCHDAAIVYSDGGDYILVVMVESLGSAYNCDSDIAELSKTVYKYFNP